MNLDKLKKKIEWNKRKKLFEKRLGNQFFNIPGTSIVVYNDKFLRRVKKVRLFK